VVAVKPVKKTTVFELKSIVFGVASLSGSEWPDGNVQTRGVQAWLVGHCGPLGKDVGSEAPSQQYGDLFLVFRDSHAGA
jgi:hypothetical protein